MTAEKVIASYGVSPYVELANPQGTDLQAPAWSQLVYPEYGLYIELRCTSLLSVGCDGVRKDDPVNRIDYFIPRPVSEYFRQRQEMFPNGSWFTIVPWPGLQEEIKP